MCNKKNIGLTLALSFAAAGALALLYYHHALPSMTAGLPYLVVWSFLLIVLLLVLICCIPAQPHGLACLLCWGPWLAVSSIFTALGGLLGLSILSWCASIPAAFFVFFFAFSTIVMISSFIQLILGLIEELMWMHKSR